MQDMLNQRFEEQPWDRRAHAKRRSKFLLIGAILDTLIFGVLPFIPGFQAFKLFLFGFNIPIVATIALCVLFLPRFIAGLEEGIEDLKEAGRVVGKALLIAIPAMSVGSIFVDKIGLISVLSIYAAATCALLLFMPLRTFLAKGKATGFIRQIKNAGLGRTVETCIGLLVAAAALILLASPVLAVLFPFFSNVAVNVASATTSLLSLLLVGGACLASGPFSTIYHVMEEKEVEMLPPPQPKPQSQPQPQPQQVTPTPHPHLQDPPSPVSAHYPPPSAPSVERRPLQPQPYPQGPLNPPQTPSYQAPPQSLYPQQGSPYPVGPQPYPEPSAPPYPAPPVYSVNPSQAPLPPYNPLSQAFLQQSGQQYPPPPYPPERPVPPAPSTFFEQPQPPDAPAPSYNQSQQNVPAPQQFWPSQAQLPEGTETPPPPYNDPPQNAAQFWPQSTPNKVEITPNQPQQHPKPDKKS